MNRIMTGIDLVSLYSPFYDGKCHPKITEVAFSRNFLKVVYCLFMESCMTIYDSEN